MRPGILRAFLSLPNTTRLTRSGLLLSTLVSPFFSQAQKLPTAVTTQNQSTSPISEIVLYHQFFRHFLYLDKQAPSNARVAGPSIKGTELNSYQRRLNLGTDQFSILRSSAASTEKDVDELDTKARAVVLAFRAKNKAIVAGQPLPTPPPELAVLQQQRDALIKRHIDLLKSELTADSGRTVDAFLKTEFAPHLRVTFVGIPRTHNPAIHPIAPFERIR